MPKVTIIGNTSWGNTLGVLLSGKGAAVKLWARSEAEAKELNQGRRRYSSTSHIGEALNGAGYDRDGYDKLGFSKDGYNRKGYDRSLR